ncbi:MAG: FKBP-type peptidyl-prolyl cis-trans isomerase [Gammaproteobacteria bacterium]|nr:FKBP-type peptidyl-prolyl cis-trans isomerase [Gammaproteobacteria bacterium]
MARKRDKKSGKGSAGQNRAATETFVNKYKAKSDVVETDSGLMYRCIESGDGGTLASKFDEVTIHQRILLADGAVIADTYQTGQPDTFPVSEAIEGLQQGLKMMDVGSRFEFVVPPELAWGRKGNSGKIGPNAVLVMNVRLISKC